MQLHRTRERPEWAETAPAQHNAWQRLAARSGGLVTPGNILTLVGVCVSIAGLLCVLRHGYWLGLAGLTAGRLMDLADGSAADLTGTKSPLGEAFDAVADKLIVGLTLLVLFIAQLSNWYILLALLVPHLIAAAIATVRYYQGRRLQPSRLGKLSMAIAWVGLWGIVLLRALPASAADTLQTIVYAILGVSILLGLLAAKRYAVN